MKILIINGPNLARLDLRDADIYGGFSYPQLSELVTSAAEKLKISVDIRQSDSESEIIQWLHEAEITSNH